MIIDVIVKKTIGATPALTFLGEKIALVELEPGMTVMMDGTAIFVQVLVVVLMKESPVQILVVEIRSVSMSSAQPRPKVPYL